MEYYQYVKSYMLWHSFSISNLIHLSVTRFPEQPISAELTVKDKYYFRKILNNSKRINEIYSFFKYKKFADQLFK